MATIFDMFNQHVADFKAKFQAKQYNEAVPVANMIVKIATEQSQKNDIRPEMKNVYISCGKMAQDFLANYKAGKYTNANANSTGNGANGGGGANGEGGGGTKWFSDDVPKLKLKDIAGLQKVKEAFLLNIFAPFAPETAEIYKRYRSDVGLQVLLYGPPGTGKTFAVKCLAGELGCKIAVVQVKDVMSKYVGEGAKVISEVFEQARELDKCIIFFDEIDSIATSRDDDESRHSKEQFTQLLTNMDGFMATTKPNQLRIIIAATNRPWALDSAIMRGGRFETKIYMPLPDFVARKHLISGALGMGPNAKLKIPVAPEVTLDFLARRFEGYAGADIKAACRQMANLAMKREIFYHLKPNGAPPPVGITLEDCEAVLKDYILSTSDEELFRYDAYATGQSLEEYFAQYESVARGLIASGKEVPPHVKRWIEDLDEQARLMADFERQEEEERRTNADSLEGDIKALLDLIESIKNRLN
ncbi:MAG: ATP-binding protein [Clostridia bacterium]|nr:ATP-binding protein [Clostridia bacterium]